jgi:hypothetical protein
MSTSDFTQDDFAPPPSSASVNDMTHNFSGTCATRARRDSRQSRVVRRARFEIWLTRMTVSTTMIRTRARTDDTTASVRRTQELRSRMVDL